MRCTAVENLLPLYVEGDLAEDKMLKVRAHLSSCDSCRRTEAEFRASQGRLHALVTPEFDEVFYESIRGAVMTEITARRLAPASFFERIRTLFLSHPLVTASLAFLLVFGAPTLGLYHQLSNSGAPLVAVEKSVRELNPNQYGESYAVNNDDAAFVKKQNVVSKRQSSSTSGVPALQNLSSVNQTNVKPKNPAPERTNEASVVAQKATDDSGASDNVMQAPAVARIEIQTSDPNIRIIWLGR